MADRADRFDRSDFDSRRGVQPVNAVLADGREGEAPSVLPIEGDLERSPLIQAYDYIVQPGDTLERIAAKWLGSAAAWRQIYDVNRSRIKDPNLIRPGLKLVIPPRQEATPREVQAQRVPQVGGTRLPRSSSRLTRVYLTYKNLPRLERMRFLKLLDEVEQDYTKDAWGRADLDWLKKLAGTPLPLDDAVALYRAYKRLPIAQQMSLVRAAVEQEADFTPDEMNQIQVEKIEPFELEPNWTRTT
jgi:hypothetical protein